MQLADETRTTRPGSRPATKTATTRKRVCTRSLRSPGPRESRGVASPPQRHRQELEARPRELTPDEGPRRPAEQAVRPVRARPRVGAQPCRVLCVEAGRAARLVAHDDAVTLRGHGQ